MKHTLPRGLGARGRLRLAAVLGALAIVGGYAFPFVGPVAAVSGYSGQFAPVVINGQMDLNGDNVVDGTDDSGAFFGDTAIIDGRLDCNAWAGENDGSAGNGSITTADDCTLVAYNGTAGGDKIYVNDGLVALPDGQMPTIYPENDGNYNDSSPINATFAWTAINGRVDTNGNGYINANDCAFFLVGSVNILANTQADTNPCGFGSPHPSYTNNGKVDLNGSNTITAADSCTSCFFGHDVTNGLVQDFTASTEYIDYTGFLAPTIIAGTADVNFDGVVNGSDDSNAFFGNTSIINGYLDCNAWATKNAGTVGDGTIDSNDDCKLLGYDGTASGLLIEVVDGEFQVADGLMPFFYPNPATPNDPFSSVFAWSVIGGRVDSNGDGEIDADECSFDLNGGADVLGSDGSNPCGFVSDPDWHDNGLVDLNSSTTISAADSCADGCFFGHDLLWGRVLNPELSVNDVTLAEGNSGQTDFTFTVSLSGPTSNAVTVDYATADGTATAPSDYTTKSGSLNFAVGDTSKTVTVKVNGDTLNEANQTFWLGLSDPTNATISDGAGLGTINNDDAAPPAATCPGFAADPRNQIVGTAGNDLLNGTAGDDIICGLGGNDTINGGGGNDLIYGGRGTDTLNGDAGNDLLSGGRGNDNLFGGPGNDNMYGGRGSDLCRQQGGTGVHVSCER